MILLPSVNYLAYKNALKQAWKDGKMSADESAMLDTLRKSLNISAEEHITIEKDVRTELADVEINNPNPGEEVGVEDTPIQPPEEANNGAGDIDVESMNNDIKDLLIAGKNSYHKGNYEEAIEYCDKVLLIEPDNSEALFFRKRTLSKIEKLQGKSAGTKKKSPPTSEPDIEAEIESEIESEPDIDIEQVSVLPSGNETAETEPNIENNSESTAEEPGMEELVPETGPVSVPNPNNNPSPGGDPNCKSCGGSGQCHWCQGSGKCYWCKGSGNCDKCNGTGKINGDDCKACKGSGKCHSCIGDGECYWCKGSGKCSKCVM